MATSGLSDTGLVILTADEIKTELEEVFKTAFGESIDLDPSGPYGQIIGIFADREADLWELLAAVKEAFNPDGATGLQLDELSSLTGTTRDGAVSSTALLSLTGDNNTEITEGSTVSTASTSVEFAIDEDATLVIPDAWVTLTEYAVGDKVNSVSNIYNATASGTSGAAQLSGTGTSIEDGTVFWRFLAESDAVIDVTSTAVIAGPSVALSGDITSIETPISGWESAVNIEDATLGSNEETDSELRVKRVTELSSASTSTYGGVTAAISDITGVTLVYIFENSSPATDSDGIPAKAFETLVVGGDGDDIAVALFDSKPLGIQAFGITSVVLTDSQGTLQTVGFTRPSDTNIYITVNLVVDIYTYPSDGDALVLEEILKLADTTIPGKNVVSSKIKSLCHNVVGVLDVTTAFIGLSADPSSETTIEIALRELADYDSSRIVVNSTSGTP